MPTTGSKFTDYYRVLQVHYEASREVISAAYKKLCQIYHPDRGIDNVRRIQLINEAYEILGDEKKRAAYHKVWLSHSFPSVTENTNVSDDTVFRYAFSDDNADAYSVMDDFFLAMKSNENTEAYLRLTYKDKSNISSEQFIEWRKAVNACFLLKSYEITPLNSINDCIIDNVFYKKAQSFSVKTTELNLHTLETSAEIVTKYAAFDGACWRVCLMLPDISASTLKFRLLSEKTGSFDPLTLYHHAVSEIDVATGLLSKEALFEAAALEVEKFKRYAVPLSFIAFKIVTDSPVKLPYCVSNFAEILKKTLRKTDICGCMSDSSFICILTHTRRNGADGAVNKIMKHINEGSQFKYEALHTAASYITQTDVNEFINNMMNNLSKA